MDESYSSLSLRSYDVVNKGDCVGGSDAIEGMATSADSSAAPAGTGGGRLYPSLSTDAAPEQPKPNASSQELDGTALTHSSPPPHDQTMERCGNAPRSHPHPDKQTVPMEASETPLDPNPQLTERPKPSRPAPQPPPPTPEQHQQLNTAPQFSPGPAPQKPVRPPRSGPLHSAQPPQHPSEVSPQDSEAMQVSPEAKPEEEKEPEYSVLILGKTGNGKSSLANTILGERKFKVGRGMFAATTEAQVESVEVEGKRLKIVDTPDYTNLTPDQSVAMQHISRWKELTNSSPDVIVLAVRCDVRYTKEEFAIYRQIRNLWGDDSIFKQRVMVAFTFGDLQDEDLEQELREVCEELKGVLKEAQGRYVQVNNRAKEEEGQEQRQAVCSCVNDVITQNLLAEAVDMPQGMSLVLLGKTGRGKSSLGNMIVGRPYFAVREGLATVTQTPEVDGVSVSGRNLKVIDTPDLQNLDPESKRQQIEEWVKLALPYPVAFGLVMRCDLRFTPEELSILRDLKTYCDSGGLFPPWSQCRLLIFFTFADRLDFTIDDYVKACPQLGIVVKEAGNICFVVNNKAVRSTLQTSIINHLFNIGTKEVVEKKDSMETAKAFIQDHVVRFVKLPKSLTGEIADWPESTVTCRTSEGLFYWCSIL